MKQPRDKKGRFLRDKEYTFLEIGEEMLSKLLPGFGMLIFILILLVH